MDETQKHKITTFLNDVVMSETVREFIEVQITKPKSREVTYLAGQMIALEILRDAWKDMERISDNLKEDSGQTGNVGL